MKDYADRFRKAGRALGFRGLDVIEVETGSMDTEGEKLLAKLPKGSRTLRLDEFGQQFTSVDFSSHIARLRDQGVADLCFLIGGAEGYSQPARDAVPDTMAFGIQTWPHRFIRFMLVEQLYRAASLEAGLPYHKA